jgi:hypothetical protein
LHNIIEQDHRFIKKAHRGESWVPVRRRSMENDRRLRGNAFDPKGQIRWLAKGDVTGQRQFIHELFGVAA